MYLIKYIKEILLVILFLLAAYLSVDKFNSYVDSKVQEKYSEKIKEYQNQVLEKVKVIESNSTKLVESRERDAEITSARLDEILDAAKRKGFVTITKEGKCNPSKEFLDTYNSVISEGNRK